LASAKSGQKFGEAEFGKNGRISDLPKPKFGATLVVTDLAISNAARAGPGQI